MNYRRVILDAALDRSVIRGTLTAPTGERREFFGWLELHTALEDILTAGVHHAPSHAPPSGLSPPIPSTFTPPNTQSTGS